MYQDEQETTQNRSNVESRRKPDQDFPCKQRKHLLMCPFYVTDSARMNRTHFEKWHIHEPENET